MKYFIVFALFVVFSFQSTNGKQYTKCELARELYSLGFPKSELPDWVCLAKGESQMITSAIGKINKKDNSRDYGIFQINNRYWCKNGSAGNSCNLSCESLLDDSIRNDALCARLVKKGRRGFGAWSAWRKNCQKSKPSVKECF